MEPRSDIILLCTCSGQGKGAPQTASGLPLPPSLLQHQSGHLALVLLLGWSKQPAPHLRLRLGNFYKYMAELPLVNAIKRKVNRGLAELLVPDLLTELQSHQLRC